MLSFRVDAVDAAAVDEWADRLHIDRSELLREALHRHLAELAADQDVQAYAEQPMTNDETAFAQIADWGPAEDWTDWADAPR
jgi:Ribbon-helix-helix protein, copG family